MPIVRTAAILATAAILWACSADTPQLPHLPEDAVILAFGNSLTYGTGAREGESYPEVLASLVDREVVNAGIPGEVSADGLRRLPGVLDEVEPDLLILCHAANDILRRKDLDQAAGNLRKMIALARERGISVVLLGVPDPGLILSTAEFYNTVAEEERVPYEGHIMASVIGDNRLKSDSVHPNAEGYRIIAEALRDLLQETGAL